MTYSAEPDQPPMGNPSTDSEGRVRGGLSVRGKQGRGYSPWDLLIYMVPGSITGPMG